MELNSELQKMRFQKSSS